MKCEKHLARSKAGQRSRSSDSARSAAIDLTGIAAEHAIQQVWESECHPHLLENVGEVLKPNGKPVPVWLQSLKGFRDALHEEKHCVVFTIIWLPSLQAEYGRKSGQQSHAVTQPGTSFTKRGSRSHRNGQLRRFQVHSCLHKCSKTCSC